MNTTETKVEHTPEPWRAVHHNRAASILSDSHGPIAGTEGDSVPVAEQHENANRIIACVNACAGIADPQSAIAAARDALKWALANVTAPDDECMDDIGDFLKGLNQARRALERLS
jgi:hypothetical protein